ncbi:hypothetical protein OH77DRAFT_263478 [Trametes cingulata]|nr:hypothetical protein OH77DRAFT_263478 [Trametes cingulata]
MDLLFPVSVARALTLLSPRSLTEGEQVEEREWIMMALINIGSLFEYGQPTAVLRRVAGIETRTPGAPGASPILANGATAGKIKVLMAKRLEGDHSKMEVDDEDVDVDKSGAGANTSEAPSPVSQEPELPAALRLAMELTFSMLAYTLRHPLRRPSEYATTLNPYNTIILTHPHLPRDGPPGPGSPAPRDPVGRARGIPEREHPAARRAARAPARERRGRRAAALRAAQQDTTLLKTTCCSPVFT